MKEKTTFSHTVSGSGRNKILFLPKNMSYDGFEGPKVLLIEENGKVSEINV